MNDDAVAVFDGIADGTLDQKPGTAGCISDDGEGGVCAVGRGLEFVRSVAVSPDGSSLYVASDLDQVGIFNRAGDGTLSQDAGTAGCVQNAGLFGCADAKALVDPTSVVVSPDGASVYVTAGFDPLVVNDGTVAVFDRAAGGTLTQKGRNRRLRLQRRQRR